MSKSVRVNVTMTSEMHQWYKQQAERSGISMSALMTYALYKNMEQEDSKKEK
ncbi:hypothetical protein [Paenibacillus sp. CGMCC 1.18879]|uniref:hypothetical protein n=1 Tax=Paenibacillus sp. CGMCC 1.18879 TaxID=2834466 RepID=UPI001CA9C944|nr:hypothetical protein [Paenibacillus sp. CGMCC 1.18879]MBY9082357.1 hypothetical protein [Paenibacillus sp. CGMCC 1.18879]